MSNAPKKWPTTENETPNVIPHGANVILGFHGLMCFCHRHNHADKNCEIGIYNGSPDHKLSITVYAVAPSFDPPYSMDMRPYFKVAGPFGTDETGNEKNEVVQFDVEKPVVSGVKYFQEGGPRDDPHNFRLILDLEGDFYPGVELKKMKDLFGPRLRVDHGLFYTLCPSRTKFSRVEVNTPGDLTPLGSVARMVGANIYLQDSGSVTLKMKNAPSVVMKPEDGKFFVLVDNGCIGCKDVNDFHLYYNTFEQPKGAPQFDVLKTTSATPVLAPGSPCALIERTVKDRGTDDTPCGSAGFGSSGEI